MSYIIDNNSSMPAVTTTVTDLITSNYVYGKIESDSGDPFFGLSAKFFDDEMCKIPSDLSQFPLSLEYLNGVDWQLQPVGGVTTSAYSIRCGIPSNTIPSGTLTKALWVRIKGWRTKNSVGLESIESYVKTVGKIVVNSSTTAQRITITWL